MMKDRAPLFHFTKALQIVPLALLGLVSVATGTTLNHYTSPKEFTQMRELKLRLEKDMSSSHGYIIEATPNFRDPLRIGAKYFSKKLEFLQHSNDLIYVTERVSTQVFIYDGNGASVYPDTTKLTGAVELKNMDRGRINLREKTTVGPSQKAALICSTWVKTAHSQWSVFETKVISGKKLKSTNRLFRKSNICPALSSLAINGHDDSNIYPFVFKGQIHIKEGVLRTQFNEPLLMNPTIFISGLTQLLRQ